MDPDIQTNLRWLPILQRPVEEIEDVFDDQIISLHNSGFMKFLVKWQGKLLQKAHVSLQQTSRRSI